jgi:Competence protein CoiA-like family
MRYALAAGERAEATPKAQAVCPGCGAEVIAKCGQIVDPYWSHRSSPECDPWWEPETRWHREWKSALAPADRQEVVIERGGIRHRADAVMLDGTVVELQTGYLPVQEIKARESFYERMVWLYRAHWEGNIRDGRRGGFVWLRAAKSMASTTKPLFWHTPQNTVWLVRIAEVGGSVYQKRGGGVTCAYDEAVRVVVGDHEAALRVSGHDSKRKVVGRIEQDWTSTGGFVRWVLEGSGG